MHCRKRMWRTTILTNIFNRRPKPAMLFDGSRKCFPYVWGIPADIMTDAGNINRCIATSLAYHLPHMTRKEYTLVMFVEFSQLNRKTVLDPGLRSDRPRYDAHTRRTLTLTFSPRRAMVMTHIHPKTQKVSRFKDKRNKQTDTGTRATASPFPLTRSVISN